MPTSIEVTEANGLAGEARRTRKTSGPTGGYDDGHKAKAYPHLDQTAHEMGTCRGVEEPEEKENIP